MAQYGNYITPQQENEFDSGIRRSLDGGQTTHNPKFDNMPVEKVNNVVKKVAMSNQQRQAEAISKADSRSFLASHPEFINSKANVKVINQLLQSWGLLSNCTYPDFQRAYDFAREADLLDIDKAELAKQQDQPLQTFEGTLTKKTYDNLDALIANERHAALNNMPAPSEEELEFDNLPNEQALPLLKALERREQHKQDVPKSGSNADVWLTLHPEFIDSERNGRLITQQLKTNGVLEDEVTVAQYEKAYQDLFSSGLLSLNQQSIAKQHREELKQRAADAVSEGGTIFDHTSVEEMEEMDLDEVRKRANAVMGRR